MEQQLLIFILFAIVANSISIFLYLKYKYYLDKERYDLLEKRMKYSNDVLVLIRYSELSRMYNKFLEEEKYEMANKVKTILDNEFKNITL